MLPKNSAHTVDANLQKHTRLRQHRVDGGHEPGAPVSDHEPDALDAAFYHAPEELLPAGRVLPHALVDRDDLPVAVRVDADGDQDAYVLHVPAPGALVTHAVHEHVRPRALQRPRAPLVDLPVDPLELVGERLRGHALSPQQLADVIDPPGAHAGHVHPRQRPLDTFLATAVAFDDLAAERLALQLRDPKVQFAGLGGQVAVVVAGPEGLPVAASLVSGGVGIRSASSSSIRLMVCSTFSRTIRSSLDSNMASSNCMISLDMALTCFSIAVFYVWRLKIVPRPGHVLFHQAPKPNLRKLSDVICAIDVIISKNY